MKNQILSALSTLSSLRDEAQAIAADPVGTGTAVDLSRKLWTDIAAVLERARNEIALLAD